MHQQARRHRWTADLGRLEEVSIGLAHGKHPRREHHSQIGNGIIFTSHGRVELATSKGAAPRPVLETTGKSILAAMHVVPG